MQKLNEVYSKIKQLLGNHTESLESVQLVEAYRRYLKPEKVRVVLLAESHVFTSDTDRQIIIPPIPDLPGYPTQYAKFLYCLGYGEKIVTNNSQLHPKRDGTPQFWKILYSCNNPVSSLEDFSPILGQTPPQQRLANKIRLLKELKAKGIWLVDASIVALYKEGKKMPNMFSALEVSWQSYTREVVRRANPEHVICIGKGVANVVSKDLKSDFNREFTVIEQPNAFLSSEKHMANYRKYSEICHSRHSQTQVNRGFQMQPPYLIIHPIGGRRIGVFAFRHKNGGACFLDVGWSETTQNPFHLLQGPIELKGEQWVCADGSTVQELTPGDPLWRSWQNWLDYLASPEGARATDKHAISGCQENGAIIDQPL